MNNNEEAIQPLIRSAKKKDVRAIYQLYLNYKHGIYTDADSKLSEDYLHLLIDLMRNKKIVVEDISIKDFRGIRDNYVKLDNRLTVFVGNNGFGKTTILDSISMTLSWLKSNIQREDRTGLPIREVDINVNRDATYSSIVAKFSFCKRTFKILLSKAKELSSEKRANELLEIKSLAGMLRNSNEYNPTSGLPLVAYYSVSRSTEGAGVDARKTNNKGKNEWGKNDAYEDVLNERHDYLEFFNWFVFMNNLANQNRDGDHESKIEMLEAQLQGHKDAMNVFKSTTKIQEDALSSLVDWISDKENELRELRERREKNESYKPIIIIETIKVALRKFMPDLIDINPEYSDGKVKLVIDKDDGRIDVQQLSQGEKTLMTLIGDISRRLALLNTGLDNPLDGNGIVLIDEIDLHLHPKWQQMIVPNLLETFKNIQFIISTHSPQVITTVPVKSIRKLNKNNIYGVPYDELDISSLTMQTKGGRSTQALEQVMDTESIPPIEEAQWIIDYKVLIETGQAESGVALQLKEKIISHYGITHPLVLECENLISLQNMKKKLKARRLANEGKKDA